MGIGANSYGSVAEVEALVPYYATATGNTFSTSTRPTLAQVEKFIDRVSGILNIILTNEGFSIPVSQATAKLALDDFVVTWTVAYTHSANRAGPFSPEKREVRGELSFRAIMDEAKSFVKEFSRGLEWLGVTRTHRRGEGLYAGGISVTGKDTFEDDTDRVLPAFTRDLQRPSELAQSQDLSAED